MKPHPLRTLVLLSCASMAGVVAPLFLDERWLFASLVLMLLPVGVASRPWIAFFGRAALRRRLSQRRSL